MCHSAYVIAGAAAVALATIVAATALACSSQSSGSDTTGDLDAAGADGNSPLCPSAPPAAGQTCAAAISCSYGGCGQNTAACVHGTWQIAESNIACQPDDPCVALGGTCSCGLCAGDQVKDDSVTCPATAGPGCVQSCCRPPGDAGESADAPTDAPADAPDAG